jgi:hypothetical protein
MKEYRFKYKGKTYECIGDDRDFQIEQFKFCLKTRDYITLKNRIINQMVAWNTLIEVGNENTGTFTPTITPTRTESVDSDITINYNGKRKTKFW